MSHCNTIFSQLLQILPRHEFEKAVNLYKGDKYVKYFSSWQQFNTMLYAQIRSKDSLRDITTSLNAQKNKWYHIGLKGVCRSTLSDANNRRPYQIFEHLFYTLSKRCKDLTPKHKFKFKNPLYSIDATTIELCLSLFPWAKYRKMKGAMKLHFLYDHAGCLPSFLVLTDGKAADIRIAKEENFLSRLLPDSIISIDRAYLDAKWLYNLNKKSIYFVTRLKKNMKPLVIGQHTKPKNKNIIADQEIILPSIFRSQGYRDKLRMITFYDPETKKTLNFITNNFKLAASTIAAIYKARWQIELFFKWIKQNLEIKSFLGTTKNAVLTQVWVAMCYYLLLAYIKYQTKFKYALLELNRLIKETLMERLALIDLLSLNSKKLNKFKYQNFYHDQQLAFF
jgi:hypothetical protein